MDQSQALKAFGALSQDTRLSLLRMLVVAGPDGLSAGTLAGRAEVSPSNVSFHLKELERAGLVSTRRESRSIIYSAEFKALSGLIGFLMRDCCSGRPEICAPALFPDCCAPDQGAPDRGAPDRAAQARPGPEAEVAR